MLGGENIEEKEREKRKSLQFKWKPKLDKFSFQKVRSNGDFSNFPKIPQDEYNRNAM